MKPNLSVSIGRLKLKNPVLVSSGTFGYGREFAEFLDLRELGAIVTKTITLRPRQGNPPPRTCETPAGMLNSIGLENPGIEVFIEKNLPSLLKMGAPVIVSISAESDPTEFAALAKKLDRIAGVKALELNISCPNLKRTKLIAQDAAESFQAVKLVRRNTDKPIITKLSPNVTDISAIALSAQKAGSDAVSLVNTFLGMGIDVEKRMPRVSTVTAGLSGPAIRPIAVRMVWEVYQKINIPIIGMGGIMDLSSALEFIIAGATAVSVGTANFINPATTIEIIRGLKQYLIRNKIKEIRSLIGSLHVQG
ncbi:MAG: dihydroorotate dehydrogenase [Candidatus Omnitrophica bacterium]|nr:dihydroorotate dehydrogenase [Candidatus Omnitrophota bacterium]